MRKPPTEFLLAPLQSRPLGGGIVNSSLKSKGQPIEIKKIKRSRVGTFNSWTRYLERAAGIEPASLAWKAKVLPLHNARAEAF